MRAVAGQLAAVDEANLVLDHVGQVNVFLVAALLTPGGFVGRDGCPDMVDLRAALERRIADLPALRRIPDAAGRRHRWLDVQPDLEHHIRLIDPVDGLAGLERVCAKLMTEPLSLDRPLWELLVVPGASIEGVGIILRVHHAIADGMAAVAIARGLFDDTGTPEVVAAVEPDPERKVASAPAPPALGRTVFGLRRILTTLVARGLDATMLLGDRSARRGVVFLDADLAALEARVRPLGATVNDALLASVAAGYVAALSEAGEKLPPSLPVSVPVALARRGTSGNQVGVMLVRLPLVAAPDVRLELIAEQTRREKLRAREQGTLELMRGPIGARIMDRVSRRQRLVAGFVTNVPGPPRQLRLVGAAVTAIWPVAVLAANVRLGVAAVSYAGGLRCGVHFDSQAVPGATFARGMKDELDRLTS